MTYEDLAAVIAKMTPEQRKKTAVVAEYDYGTAVPVESLVPLEDFNGQEEKDQLVIIPCMSH